MRLNYLLLGLLLITIGLSTACTSAGTALVPLRAVGSANGDASGPQVFIGNVPMNALVRVHGNITYTVQVTPPYVTYDGDYTIIVEPLPGMEAEAVAAAQRGDILIRRAGVPGALNAPGTRAGYIAGLVRMSNARKAAEIKAGVDAYLSQPPPPPPPTPEPTRHDTPPCPISFVPPQHVGDCCPNGACGLNR